MTHEAETVDAEIVEERIDGATALMALTKAETDIQISTAKQYPRSIKEFKRQAMELVTLDEETAASMFYALPRAGKTIQGMSVRLAEVVQSAWGNIRAEADVVAIDDKFVTAMGSCLDLEKNVATRIRVKRRITDRNGRRYNDDMIAVTSNAACSIALREAIFKVVPRALVKDLYDAAKKTAVGDAKSLVARRNAAMDWFQKSGVTPDKVLVKIGRKGVEDITLDDLVILTGLRTAIKDGETSIEEAFAPDSGGSARQSDKTQALNERLKNKGRPDADSKVIFSKPGDPEAEKEPKQATLPDTDSDLAGED